VEGMIEVADSFLAPDRGHPAARAGRPRGHSRGAVGVFEKPVFVEARHARVAAFEVRGVVSLNLDGG